ncbi:sugar ABC transporter substrate-binding protein [Streptococcus ictaluri]|uniref:ABC transporter, solute-binding protein n=1 Tax=Streptococcus ictaluri 707-05 TaxID=764299 RepID=G5K1P0_9STRE|nr:extracellular solute-binding protein [Streptococcus ictaluri]EHI70000.1 hypothetical protein STRIC_2298 [Streptococcus ictaluri 707-05]
MINKKASLTGFICLSLLSLSACQSSNQSEKNAAKGDIFTGKLEKKVTIKVLENDTAISKGYFKEIITAFNNKYAKDGIKAVDANTDQFVDLAKDGPYGYGPDVIYQANDIIMKYAADKHIYPLPVDRLGAYKETSKEAWTAFTLKKDGKKYICGMPVNVQMPLIYYRKDLLPADWKSQWDKNNNDQPDMLENWSDMLAFSRQRHQENPSQYGYMQSIYDSYFSNGFLLSYGAYIFGNHNTDTKDIGLSKGQAEKGAHVLQQLASAMNEESINDTIQTSAYSKIGNGTYFATMSTPDVYSTFLGEMTQDYMAKGKSEAEAKTLAKENLGLASIPKLPKSGDLEDGSQDLIPTKTMGGISGYAVSAYTKAPNASLAFIEFATNYQNIKKRHQLLGIVPTRVDLVKEIGGSTKDVYLNLEQKNIVLMPSNGAASQIWTPTQTYFADITKDVFRPESEKKYPDNKALKEGLKKVDQQIHDAIHTLE